MLLPPTSSELATLADKARAFNLSVEPWSGQCASPKSLRRRLPPAVVDELVCRYQAGEHTTALSKEYGISKSGLITLLRNEGVKLRRRPLSKVATKRAVQLYEEGLTIQQVADQVNSSYGAIRKMLHREGVEVRQNCIKRMGDKIHR